MTTYFTNYSFNNIDIWWIGYFFSWYAWNW